MVQYPTIRYPWISVFTLSVLLFLGACGSNGVSKPGDDEGPPSGNANTDTTAPYVLSTTPANNAPGVSVGSSIRATFNESVDITSATTSTFTVSGISGSVSTSGTVVTFVPDSALAPSTTYTVTILGGAAGVRDRAGNSLVSTYSWHFSTESADTTPPTISLTTPADGATGVSPTSTISVAFSEAVNASTLTNSSFIVSGVNGTVSTTGATATFTPSNSLATSTTYTVTIYGGANGVHDLSGNALANDYSWSFTTAAPAACNTTSIRCVGNGQEYATIQSAVNDTIAGDTVIVYDGNYSGFRVQHGGTSANRLVIKAQGSAAVINQANATGSEGITIENADYVTVEGFAVTGMSGYGFATHNATPTDPMRGLIIRNNTVTNSGSTNIYLSEVADSIIEGNTASGSASSHGIYLANGGSDNTILRGNVCFDNAKNGIHFNGDLSVGGDGLHSELTIEDNVLYGNTGNGLDMDGVQNSLVQNNLIYGNGHSAMRAFQIDAAAGPQNLRIVNNTFVVPASGTGWALKLSEDGGGHVMFNNIILSSNSGTGSISVGNTSFVSDHNVVGDRLSLDNENTVVTLANWKLSGYDSHSVASSTGTVFVDSTHYQLKIGSPAADAGVSSFGGVSAPADDIVGTPRYLGTTYDAGAYESF